MVWGNISFDLNMFYWTKGFTDNIKQTRIVLYFNPYMEIDVHEPLQNMFNIMNTNTEIFILFPNLLM